MTWPWSHTQEAYDHARAELKGLPRDEVRVIWAEWKASNWRDHTVSTEFVEETYFAAFEESDRLTTDALTDDIWEWASELRDCTNGGHHLYGCPFGCDPHLLSAGPDDGE